MKHIPLFDPISRSRSPIAKLALALSLGFAGASALATAPLRAQETAASLEGLNDADARASVRALITSFAAKGLPTAPLVTKVREGLAKGASADRIRSATALLAQRLEAAATALAPARGSDELSAGADALQAGIPTGTLRDMRRIWPVKPLTVPLGVLSEMVASGVPQANATRRVRELLVKGATSTQLAALGLNVRADVEAGLAPDAAMELRSKGVLSLLVPLPTNTTIATPPRRPHDPPRR